MELAGWVLGSRSVNISNNEFYCTRDNLHEGGPRESSAILVQCYDHKVRGLGAPVEQVLINDNILVGVVVDSVWATLTHIEAGKLIRAKGYIYLAGNTGTTGTGEPDWESSPGTKDEPVVDDGVHWLRQGLSPLLGWEKDTEMKLHDRRLIGVKTSRARHHR